MAISPPKVISKSIVDPTRFDLTKKLHDKQASTTYKAAKVAYFILKFVAAVFEFLKNVAVAPLYVVQRGGQKLASLLEKKPLPAATAPATEMVPPAPQAPSITGTVQRLSEEGEEPTEPSVIAFDDPGAIATALAAATAVVPVEAPAAEENPPVEYGPRNPFDGFTNRQQTLVGRQARRWLDERASHMKVNLFDDVAVAKIIGTDPAPTPVVPVVPKQTFLSVVQRVMGTAVRTPFHLAGSALGAAGKATSFVATQLASAFDVDETGPFSF